MPAGIAQYQVIRGLQPLIHGLLPQQEPYPYTGMGPEAHTLVTE